MSAIFTVSALGFIMGADNIRQAEAQLDAIYQTNYNIDRENRAMYKLAKNLRQDRAAMERLCRQELGVVRPDEVVYLLPQTK